MNRNFQNSVKVRIIPKRRLTIYSKNPNTVPLESRGKQNGTVFWGYVIRGTRYPRDTVFGGHGIRGTRYSGIRYLRDTVFGDTVFGGPVLGGFTVF